MTASGIGRRVRPVSEAGPPWAELQVISCIRSIGASLFTVAPSGRLYIRATLISRCLSTSSAQA